MHGSGNAVDTFRSLTKPESGLKRLRELYAFGLEDASIEEMCRNGSSLGLLKTLWVSGTKLNDYSLRVLSSENTAFPNLEKLILPEGITKAGIKELARKDTGLKNLSEIWITSNIELEGLQELGRADNGLKRLNSLSFQFFPPEFANELLRSGTRFASMKVLSIYDRSFDSKSAIPLAAPGALDMLTTLDLSESTVDNEFLNALANPGAGLKSLRVLKVVSTRVNQQGVNAIRVARPELQIEFIPFYEKIPSGQWND